MKKTVAWLLALCFIPCIILSCASIIGKGGPQTLNIRSAPDQCEVSILDEKGTKVFAGQTPTTVALEKKKGYFSGKKYTVKIAKAGCIDKTVTVDTNVNGWYVGGNLIFGGLIGYLIVDPLTGAMWSLDTNEINVTMEPAKEPVVEPVKEPGQESSIAKPIDLNVVLLQDVPTAFRTSMVRIVQ